MRKDQVGLESHLAEQSPESDNLCSAAVRSPLILSPLPLEINATHILTQLLFMAVYRNKAWLSCDHRGPLKADTPQEMMVRRDFQVRRKSVLTGGTLVATSIPRSSAEDQCWD